MLEPQSTSRSHTCVHALQTPTPHHTTPHHTTPHHTTPHHTTPHLYTGYPFRRYSWIVSSLVGAVYMFGFILMCPQVRASGKILVLLLVESLVPASCPHVADLCCPSASCPSLRDLCCGSGLSSSCLHLSVDLLSCSCICCLLHRSCT